MDLLQLEDLAKQIRQLCIAIDAHPEDRLLGERALSALEDVHHWASRLAEVAKALLEENG